MLLDDFNLRLPEVHFNLRIYYHCTDIDGLLQSRLEILIKLFKHPSGGFNELALVIKTILYDGESCHVYELNWESGVQSWIFRATEELCCCTQWIKHGYNVARLFPFVVFNHILA